jgi:tRNA(Ser,Leu) C12 N-acetylase TAN1
MATALEGQRDLLRLALKRLGRFRGSGFRNIVLGEVPDPIAFLPIVAEAFASDRHLQMSLGKLIPMDLVVRFQVPDAVDTLAAAAEPFLDRLGSGTFFVRMERRGLRHELHASDTEQAVGERLVTALRARGHAPRVRFDDPDHVVIIESVGEEAGLALVPRAVRSAFPFVRVK